MKHAFHREHLQQLVENFSCKSVEQLRKAAAIKCFLFLNNIKCSHSETFFERTGRGAHKEKRLIFMQSTKRTQKDN